MCQEFQALRFDAVKGQFVLEATLGEGAMERHRERHACRYAKDSTLTPAQRRAAAEALGSEEDRVLVFESRTTEALYVYRSAPQDNACHCA